MDKLAFYDMDRTITRRATYTAFLWSMAWHCAPWRLLLAPLSLFFALGYAAKLFDRVALKQANQRLYIGRDVSHERLKPHIERFAGQTLANNIHPGALAQIEADRARGYRLVMATASYRLYAEAIAQGLHFDAVIATDLEELDSGRVIPRIHGENCYGAAKLAMILAWMSSKGLDRQSCNIRAYSDHVSDVPMLEFADEAFAVNPSRRLLTSARLHDWPVREWHGSKDG